MMRCGVYVKIYLRLIRALDVYTNDTRISVMREHLTVAVALGLSRKGRYRF